MRSIFSHRIMAGFLIMTALLVLVGYFSSVATRNLQKASRAIMKENVTSLKAAEELEIALLNQKGLVSSYFLDGDINWLQTLEEKKKDFETWFKKAQEVALTNDEEKILQDIFVLYKVYDTQRNRAIKSYQTGSISEARRILLNDMKNNIESLYQRCEDLIFVNETLIANAEISSQKEVSGMTRLIWGAIVTMLCLGIFMGFLIARKINDQLIYSARMASLGQLSATIAHEIRNPLTAIKMRVYSLQNGLEGNVTLKEDINIIGEEIDRMERIIKNFLDFARPSEPILQKCNINQILEGVINLLSSKASSQSIEIQTKLNTVLPEIEIDKEQMRQVFLNIILNAIEAMPHGGILEVSTSRNNGDRKEKECLEIKIKDTGIGITPEIKRRIFEPFMTTKEKGTGLGLFIAARIVQMHEGTMEVESRLGEGTILAVKVPLIRGA